MSFKPKKSQSLSLRKGKLDEDVCLKVASQDIPRIRQEPYKSLGRCYGSSLKDTKRGSEALRQVSVGLQSIDKISFLIRSVYDLLPSNANLVPWGIKDDSTCPLCQGRQTTEHVLSSCKVALSQGRYTWKNNRVL
ncbi:chemosensory receptor a [Plakobranchus ocellatus]|uniref:Chemosensory receptor a n=1 Tax=Plakobranchus ocellatus TaxID=259542 RepID=A0AAV4DIY7_9GAST|nr:chemosensory receptor a [Plakobranchus ocellatus]